MKKNREVEVQKTIGNSIETKYQLKQIELNNFTLIPPSEMPQEFEFDVQIKQRIQAKENLVVVSITLGIKNPQDIALGNVSLLCVFEVENLEELVKNKNSIKDLGLVLNTITIATARGVMFGLFRGTFLHNAILPIVDVQVLQNN